MNSQIAFALEPIQIEKVSVNPKTIDVSKNEKTKIQFETTRDAFLTIELKDENMNPINHFELGLKPKGAQTFSWDGKNEKGGLVKTDVVIYTIDARTEDSQYAHYDPSSETGGIDLKFSKFELDKETGKVEFVLPQAARARLRAGFTETALLVTLFDWEAKEAGGHEFLWDGRDKSGEINLLKLPHLNLNLNAFSLPDNAILIKGLKPGYLSPDQSYSPIKQNKHIHYLHPRILCHEPKFQITFPENQKNSEGDTIVKGKVPVTLTIDPKDEVDLVRKRFEVMIYLDMNFLFEEEQGVSPATFEIDFSNVQVGEHLLTFNVMSYDDHIGVETVKVKVGS